MAVVSGMMAQAMRSVCHFRASIVHRMATSMTTGKNHRESISRCAPFQ